LNGLRFALAMYSGKNIFISRLLRPAGRNKRYFHRWGRGGKLYLCAKASPFGRGGCERSEQTERASPAEFYMAAISISDVEQELDHIAIVDNVFLALGALQTLGLDGGVIEVVGFQIAVANDAGTDEAALEIAVDLAGSLRCFGALADGPCAALLLAVGQEGDQAQQIIAGSDEVVQTAISSSVLAQMGM